MVTSPYVEKQKGYGPIFTRLSASWKWGFMLLTRKHLRAGRALTGFPLCEEDGLLGYKLGYCKGCNESILIRTSDSQEILAYLFRSQKQYKKLINRLAPKYPFKRRFIRWLVGKLEEIPAVENHVLN